MKSLPPLLSTGISSVDRRKLEAGRVWYNTNRWKRLRQQILLRDRYTCQEPDCKKLVLDTSKLIAHHKKAHKGNEKLFWDENNIVTVCKDCHDGVISRRERNEELKGNWY